MIKLLEELPILVAYTVRAEYEPPPISEYYKEVTPLRHLIQSGNCPLAFTTHTKASSKRPGHLSMKEDK
jgi:hypothetical protein